jgi:hypothetical protein
MRKLLLAVVCLMFITGLAIAAEVTVVKFDKDAKKVTVKEGDAEKTYKISDKVKVTVTDKDGNSKEGTAAGLEKALSNEKAMGKMKLDITTSGDEITEVKMRGGKKKNN